MAPRISASDAAPPVAEWVELTVRLPPADADLVAEALAAFAGGVSVEPVIRSDEAVDFAYTITDAPALVRASFPAPFGRAARRRLRAVLAALPLSAPLARLRYRAVPDREWEEAWKREFGVLRAGRRLVLCPSWESYAAGPEDLVITLDPGRAFGTGQHATTRLCLAALEGEYEHRAAAGLARGAMLDVGTGSGILAIAAGLLGAGPVRGVDIDAQTVPVARENLRRNRVRAQVRAGSLGADWPWREPAAAAVVAANLTPAVLIALAAPLAAAVEPGGALLVSGFTGARERDVLAALRAAGLTVETVASGGDGEEWRCATLRCADGGRPEAGRPEAGRSDVGRSDVGRSDVGRSDADGDGEAGR